MRELEALHDAFDDLPRELMDDRCRPGDLELTERASAAFSSVLRAAGERSLVLVFEDLHHADVASLVLLTRLLEAARASRILVVATVCPQELRGSRISWITRLRRHGRCTELPLARLGKDAVEAYLRQVTGGIEP